MLGYFFLWHLLIQFICEWVNYFENSAEGSLSKPMTILCFYYVSTVIQFYGLLRYNVFFSAFCLIFFSFPFRYVQLLLTLVSQNGGKRMHQIWLIFTPCKNFLLLWVKLEIDLLLLNFMELGVLLAEHYSPRSSCFLTFTLSFLYFLEDFLFPAKAHASTVLCW